MREIEWEARLLEPRADPEAERRFQRATGRPGSVMRFFVGSEWGVDAIIDFSAVINLQVGIDADLADLMGLVVSQDNSCRFCFGTARAFLRVLGMPEERIRQLEVDMDTADFTERERAALRFARRLSRSNPLVGPDELDTLRGVGFDELQVREICGCIALHLFFNRASTLIALPPDSVERFPDRWYVRLFRPFIKLGLGGIRRRTHAVPLAPGEADGPYAPIVEALGGLPVARSFRRVIDAPAAVLPARTRGLVFAVIARALGCTLAEAEARRMLAGEGLEEAEVDEVLTHLSAPGLSELERVAVPFARETVWYEPAQIQRRGRAALASMSREEFIDLVVATSLANAVCRLGVLVGDCR